MSDSLCRTTGGNKPVWYLLPDAKYSTQIKISYNILTLIGGKPVITSVGGGGSDSDFRWDGRKPDEEDNTFRKKMSY